MFISGIYKITNIITNDSYIGSAVNLNSRKRTHFANMNLCKHPNKHLQSSYNKYGKDNFTFEILAKCPKEYLLKLEQFFIDIFNPTFNKRKQVNSNLGLVLTEEHKQKISESNKNHPSRVGRKLSDEYKDSIRKAHLGKTLSNETKEKISQKFKGENHPNAKLNQDIANEIKCLFGKLKMKEIASKYNVSVGTIEKIKMNKIWAV
jgi:group I intron endonuclease